MAGELRPVVGYRRTLYELRPLRHRQIHLDTAIGHRRDVLGDEPYEWVARKGETISTTQILTYAYDQIDQA